MNEQEQAIADEVYAAIQRATNYSARSLQARSFQAGVSDLGFCSERLRRMLDQQVPEDSDMLTAWIGTWLGAGMEEAMLSIWPDAIQQAEVKVELEGERGVVYTLQGHPDIIRPEGYVLDGKTDFGLNDVENRGPSEQQQFQRHLYAKGAFEAGMFYPQVRLEDVQVGNLWMDRGGVDKRLHVQMERYDPDVVKRAGAWLEEVVYAYVHEQEARKEPPREMCAVVCGFFSVCRAWDTDVEGLIEDPRTLAAVDLYVQGADLERAGKKMKDIAKNDMGNSIAGSTGTHNVRSVWVNPTEVAAGVRAGYYKIDIRPIAKPKPKKRPTKKVEK